MRVEALRFSGRPPKVEFPAAISRVTPTNTITVVVLQLSHVRKTPGTVTHVNLPWNVQTATTYKDLYDE